MRIGIDLGGTKIEGIAIDDQGKECARRRIATPRDDYGATVVTVAALVTGLERSVGGKATVGIGIPGAESPATGLIKNGNSTWLNGKTLRRDLETALKRDVRLANDADCFALSEATDGAGADAQTVFGVILGTGVGGAIVRDGKLLAGPNAIAGEWGHNPLPWARDDELVGRTCWCGQAGCIETWLSGPGVAADHAQRTGESRTAIDLFASAIAGNRDAVVTRERYANRLARALASVINIIDPHVIVLGGGLSSVDYLYMRVPKLWGRHVFSDTVDTRLLSPDWGDAGGARGAAWLWPPEPA